MSSEIAVECSLLITCLPRFLTTSLERSAFWRQAKGLHETAGDIFMVQGCLSTIIDHGVQRGLRDIR